MSAASPASARAGHEPDPRIERSCHRILAAVLDILGQAGYRGLTVEGVAARAGVGKSTIYRHWPGGRPELIEDAIRTLKSAIAPPVEGSVRDRLTALLQQVAVTTAGSTWSACLPAIIDAAERDPEVLAIHRRFSLERRQVLVDLLEEGVTAGEIASGYDIGLLAECLIGPIIVRRLLLHEPFDPASVPRLVAQVLPPGGLLPEI